VKLAAALQNYKLPGDIALDPNGALFRERDHELMSTVFVGEVHPPGVDPFDVFTARVRVGGEKAEGPDAARACRLAFPS